MALGRDSKGKFIPGNGGGGARPGAGRPRGTRKELLAKAVSDEDWLRIYRAMYDAAVAGDVRAATFLDERNFGKVSGPEDEPVTDVPQITVTFHQPSIIPPASTTPEQPPE